MSMQNWPKQERPREKLLYRGVETLSNAELLAIFIHCGTRGRTAMDIGHDLLVRFKSIKGIVESDVSSLCEITGIGPVVYSRLVAALELGSRYLEEKVGHAGPITSPDITRRFIKSRLLPYQHEVFSCLFMDNRHRLITFKELFSGTIDGASVYPREVVKLSLKYNAAAVIFAHNHPSGVAEPSQSDIQITRQLKDALLLVDVRVLDHLIIGNQDIVSLAERGLL